MWKGRHRGWRVAVRMTALRDSTRLSSNLVDGRRELGSSHGWSEQWWLTITQPETERHLVGISSTRESQRVSGSEHIPLKAGSTDKVGKVHVFLIAGRTGL